MEIASNKEVVNQSIQDVFLFLKDTNNIFYLLPKEGVSDWNSDELKCSFKVQGGIIISFEQFKLEEPTKIYLKSGEKSPFPFTLTINLTDVGNNQTEGYLKFEGEVSKFLKMMIKTPLENLFNYMTAQMKARFE